MGRFAPVIQGLRLLVTSSSLLCGFLAITIEPKSSGERVESQDQSPPLRQTRRKLLTSLLLTSHWQEL